MYGQVSGTNSLENKFTKKTTIKIPTKVHLKYDKAQKNNEEFIKD